MRDLLYVDDLLDAYDGAVAHIDVGRRQVYNVGGGPENTLSVWAEFGPLLEQLLGRPHAEATFGDWRPGDQQDLRLRHPPSPPRARLATQDRACRRALNGLAALGRRQP